VTLRSYRGTEPLIAGMIAVWAFDVPLSWPSLPDLVVWPSIIGVGLYLALLAHLAQSANPEHTLERPRNFDDQFERLASVADLDIDKVTLRLVDVKASFRGEVVQLHLAETLKDWDQHWEFSITDTALRCLSPEQVTSLLAVQVAEWRLHYTTRHRLYCIGAALLGGFGLWIALTRVMLLINPDKEPDLAELMAETVTAVLMVAAHAAFLRWRVLRADVAAVDLIAASECSDDDGAGHDDSSDVDAAARRHAAVTLCTALRNSELINTASLSGCEGRSSLRLCLPVLGRLVRSVLTRWPFLYGSFNETPTAECRVRSLCVAMATPPPPSAPLTSPSDGWLSPPPSPVASSLASARRWSPVWRMEGEEMHMLTPDAMVTTPP